MAKCFYEIKRIPDLTLSKYNALEEGGVDGVIKKHEAFLRQIHRQALLSNEIIHWIFEYNPCEKKGKRLKIFIEFESENINAYVDNMVQNSLLAPFYDIVRVVPAEQIDAYKSWLYQIGENELGKVVPASLLEKYRNWLRETKENEQKPVDKRKKLSMDEFVLLNINREKSYKYMSTLIKREKFSRADRKEHGYFYSVNKWEMNDDARMFGLYTMMQNMNSPCVYCVDIKPVDYTNQIEEPEMLGSIMQALRAMLTLRVEKGMNGSTSFQKDENADYTLERYKDLIKEISANPHFQANIRVYADTEEYAGMLLDAVASEALDKGAHDMKTLQGAFTLQDIISSNVEFVCSNHAPAELKFWSTLFTVAELKPFAVLPALYPGESIEMPKETVPGHVQGGLYLGKDSDGYEVYFPLKNLSKHAFLAGVPGSGKTNSMLHLATTLYSEFGIPFLILEPAKQEYRALVNKPEMKGITVFSPSSGTMFLLHINPFQFPKKMVLAEHIRSLINVFDGSFSMDPPMPFLLDRAIERVYRNKGWLPYMMNDGSIPYPTMQELYETLEQILDETDYEGEIKGNLKSVLQVRIGSLLSREMGDVFNVSESSVSPEEWLQRSVVIELEAMGSGPANFLTLMLATLIRETLKVNPVKREEKDKKPRHVIFLEEAHNLIGPKAQKEGGEAADPKIAATAYIVKMLAEVRALNEAIIIADQLPTAMASEVLKNTSLKLGHRMTAEDDRQLLGSTMSADDVQLERMAAFTQGKTLVIYEGLLKPFEMQVEQWSKVKGTVHDELYDSPSDDELYDKLCYEGSQYIKDMEKSFNITMTKMNSLWDGIMDDRAACEKRVDSIIELCGTVEDNRNHLENTDWNKVSKEKSEEVFEVLDHAVNQMEKDIAAAKIQFNHLCDRMEEVIFSLYSYKKQNRYFQEKVKKAATDKLLEYRDFCQGMKEKCEFERTEKQRERRTAILKLWE